MGRKWEPFDVQAELVKIFMDEGVCPWCGGELTEEEARQVEAKYFAKREAASEAEWARRLAGRIERTLPRGEVEGRMKEWIHPSRRSPEGRQAFEDALEEMRHYGAAVKAETTQAVYDTLLPGVRNALASEGEACGPKHYGLWHDDNGWWWRQDRIFITEHRAVALAQADAVNRFRPGDWRVRCIEEWADDQ